jgi:PAS domain S-box-containing protein
LAGDICEVPTAVIALVGETEVWLKAEAGSANFSRSPRETSFCAHNLESGEPLLVPDATKDRRFADNPFVTGEPRIRLYASAPLITPHGETLGALCVIDRVPRSLSERQLHALRILSQLVMTELELRRAMAESQRRSSELRLVDACVARIKDMVLITEAAPLSEPGPRLVYVNEAFCRQTGYAREEVLGRSPRLLQGPRTDHAALARIRAALERQAPVREELINYTKSGEEYWVELDVVPITGDDGRVTHFGAVQRDVSPRKLAEAQLAYNAARLQASEADYRVLFENHPQPMWVTDVESLRFIRVNAAALRHYGYEEEEFLRLTTLDIRPPADAAELVRNPARLRGEADRIVRSRHRKKNGTPIEVEVTSRQITLSGRPARLAMITDLTQRLRIEREAQRADRARQMLSRLNAALIRESEEARLLTAICQIAVDVGGASLAWVGYALEDEPRTITIEAYAGFEHGFLQNVRPSWAEDGPMSQTPAARTVRTGQATVIPDLAQDEGFRPFWEAAQARGYRGLIVLPIKDRAQVLGVLALYLPEVRESPPGELSLLQELADNLAFGIVSLRARIERQKTTEALLAIARSVSVAPDQGYFATLMHGLVAAVGADLGAIGERLTTDPGTVRTLGVVVDGQTAPNFEYAIAGTPCANVTGADAWFEPRGVSQRYAHLPDIVRRGTQAYLGLNLLDTAGQPIGVICVEFGRPMARTDFLLSTLQIFAGRAASELQRQRIEARTREQAEMLDKAQDAILVRDLQHRITFWNRSAERVYGWTSAEAIGQSVFDLIYRDEDDFQQAMAHLLRHGEWNGEFTHVRKDGQKLAVESRWTLVRDDTGQPKAVLAINTDITERKKVEQQFLRAQRMESLGTLASGIAHDLNNLLAPITMGVDLLSRLDSNPKSVAILESMQRSAKRGAELVKQVLSFARGVDGTRTPQRLEPILQEVESMARNTFPRNITIELNVIAGLWPVVADATQLNQVLLNLCVNARDAMPNGGRLELSAYNVEIDPETAVLNRTLTPGRYVVLQVTDNGAGIPQTIIDRIFEPFFTTKEVGKGTGLGLSTVLSIVRSHGGSVNVYSEPNQGSVFKVYLPAQPEVTTASVSPSAADKFPRGRGELILVVDDETSIQDIVRQALETFGYQVVTASDGAEAVALFAQRHNEITLVLTDMMMPVMDGLALIAALRRIKPDVLIVAGSGLNANANLSRALNLGVNHFLAKPYAVDVMLQTFRKALAAPEN